MANASIVLTGLSASDPRPGSYLEILFAQGESAGAGVSYPALLLGNRTSAGSATADTVVYGPDTAIPCQTEADVITLFGTGSELHRMWLQFTSVNKSTACYLLAVTASGGTAASATIVVSGVASGNGVARVYVGNDFVDTAITSGDAVDTIGAAITASINTKTRWPVTAAYTGGSDTITLTARHGGPRGNQIKIQSQITAGITTALTSTSLTSLSSGATADSNTNALATILARRFYWIVSAAEDATQVGALLTQVNAQAQPTSGIRQRVIFGSTDTISNTVTSATGLNGARAECIWQPVSEYTPAELAAHNAGVYALRVTESLPKPKHNFSNYPSRDEDQSSWLIKAPRSGTGPTNADILTALNNGITPVKVLASGRTALVKRVTTKSLNGATADYRIRDAHKVDICDVFGEELLSKINLQFGGNDIANDPAEGQRVPGPNVTTPRVFKAAIEGLLDVFDANDQLQDLAIIKRDLIVQRETSPSTRMAAQIPLRPIDIHDQSAVKVLQVA